MGVQAKLECVFVVVKDMSRSLTFYEHLGFTFPPGAFAEQYVEVSCRAG